MGDASGVFKYGLLACETRFRLAENPGALSYESRCYIPVFFLGIGHELLLLLGDAFIGAGLIVAAMHYGGQWVMLLLAALTIFIIINSNRRFRKKTQEVVKAANRSITH